MALASVASRLPDLCLLDIRMPGIDGYEVCRQLKANSRTKDLPVIFISALGDLEDRLAGFRAGGIDFISKPFQREEVLSRVKTQLELHRVRRALSQSNRSLLQANRKLLELDRLQSMFIASVSHELRTPLNSIIGFSHVLLQGVTGDLNDRQNDYLHRINRSGQHLLDLITDIIDISKIESGRLEVDVTRFAVAEVVEEAVKGIRPLADDKGLSLEIEIAPGLHSVSDRRRLLQCLLNLLSNAVKYSEKGSIQCCAYAQDEQLMLRVTDNGQRTTVLALQEKIFPICLTPLSGLRVTCG